jgi:hypothetical protein
MASMSFEECDRFLHWVTRTLAEVGFRFEEPRRSPSTSPTCEGIVIAQWSGYYDGDATM